MATIVEADDMVFGALLHGRPRAEDRSFLREHIDRMSTVFTGAAARFVERCREVFDKFDLEYMDRKLNAIGRKLRYGNGGPAIDELTTIGQFQQANLTMQRWLMTSIKARKLRHADRCWGWRDTYVDLEPHAYGEDHTDWKKLHNGLTTTDADGNTYFTQYFDAVDEDGGQELHLPQQVDLMRSLVRFEYLFTQGTDDPCSPDNNSL